MTPPDTPITTAAKAETMPVLVEWIVELAKRDIMRTQTDFVGRMNQAMGGFEAVCDEYPDGEWPEDARDNAGEDLAALAGLALAQLAMVQNPANPLSELATRIAPLPAEDGWRDMASAPKDGRYIDVARNMGDFGWVVGVSRWVNDLGGGWISKGTGVFGELGLAHPTHWRPRPTPPAAQTEGEPA